MSHKNPPYSLNPVVREYLWIVSDTLRYSNDAVVNCVFPNAIMEKKFVNVGAYTNAFRLKFDIEALNPPGQCDWEIRIENVVVASGSIVGLALWNSITISNDLTNLDLTPGARVAIWIHPINANYALSNMRFYYDYQVTGYIVGSQIGLL